MARTMGPLKTVGTTILKNFGPIGDHRSNFLPVTLGPSEAIGSIPCETRVGAANERE